MAKRKLLPPSAQPTPWFEMRERVVNHEQLQKAMRAEWEKRTRPKIVFPSREAKLAWLKEGAETSEVPALPEGAYYE